MPSSPTTARVLITDAFDTIGAFAPGDALPPEDAQGALGRLNRMMGSWAIQSLTIAATSRNVFGLTSGKGTYTIGPGGDFDTTRPTMNGLTGCALLLNGAISAARSASITSVGNVATVTTTVAHGLSDDATVTIHGALPAAYNGTFTIDVLSTTTFSYLFEGGSTPATGTITALPTGGQTVVEIPRALYTEDAYDAIAIKDLQSGLFTGVYYNPSYFGGLGQVTLWPVPNTALHQLVLYVDAPLSQFSTLDTSYDLPDGAPEAISYNLALRLAAPYGKPITPDVLDFARTSLGTFKRGNVRLSDLASDYPTNTNRGGYNIETGA